MLQSKLMPYFADMAKALAAKLQPPTNNLDLSGKTREDANTVFSNGESGSQYFFAFTQNGTIADKMAAKLQSDITSILRREAQQGARSRVQAVFDEVNRSARLGSPEGPINRCLLGAPKLTMVKVEVNPNATV